MERREFLFAAVGASAPAPYSIVLDVKRGTKLWESGAKQHGRSHPGSTVKPLIAVALAGAGEQMEVRCTCKLRIGTRTLACSHPVSPEPIDLPAAIAWSCNEYFTAAARRLPPSVLCDSLRRYGLDVQTPRTPDQQALMGIGEWGVLCSLPELAAAYRKLSLLRLDADPRYKPVWEGLEGAAEYGTARLARPAGIAICGKTGTSPNRARTGNYALFAGWAPAVKPRVVVAVLASGGSGGASAAPAARYFFEKFA
jgi:cell division protein FtsI/penicillin-binding protein 2